MPLRPLYTEDPCVITDILDFAGGYTISYRGTAIQLGSTVLLYDQYSDLARQ
jgi:hypothetical protein